jgi:hypothetical protein
MINLTFKNFEECKEYMKSLLEQTDYICLADVKDDLVNYQDLIIYRSSLRNYFFNPILNVSLPEEPTPIWK